MKHSRRSFLGGISLLAVTASRAGAWIHGNAVPIGTGWNTLPLGCGGLITGLHIANDGSMVCRTDVGNIYRWSGKTSDYANGSARWVPLLTYSTLAGKGPAGGNPVINTISLPLGGWEHVLAPGNSTVHAAIFADMTGTSGKAWLWYSTNSGATWGQSNIAFLNSSADTNGSPYKTSYYKIIIDPVNENVAYCGMPLNSGNSAGVYTSLNQAGGSTLATWASVKTSGATPIPGIVGITDYSGDSRGIACGLVFDPSQGTTTIGGQTVTKRIILPVGGVGIYESTDGGVTFSEIAVSQMGTASFYVTNAAITPAGIYYCVVISSTIGGIWRYASGVWTNITPNASYATTNSRITTTVIIKPSDPAYLSVTGPNGIGAGYTSSNADTGTPSWGGRTGGQNSTLKAASYDIGWINHVFGQGASFTYGPCQAIDPLSGACFWAGNQSLFYFAVSVVSTVPIGPPNYVTDVNTFSWSMGRGTEVTVSQDVLCPPGGTYPVLAPQDIGAPMRGTFLVYPNDTAIHQEYTCESLEYAANDPSFIVARATGQNSSNFTDTSVYSENYGADGTWNIIAAVPTVLWQAQFTATISDGVGGAGNILNVTSPPTNPILANTGVFSAVQGGGTSYGRTMPYGTGGTTGTGGVGTYQLAASSSVLSPTTLYTGAPVQGGQTVAVDKDHWLTVPAGLSQHFIPAYTANATGAATWALTNLPSKYWMMRSWVNGPTSKPFAVGYGADLGVVWACLFDTGTARLYRSTDSGATFSQIATWSVTTAVVGIYCLSVPGFPNELWICGSYTGGGGATTAIWHITNANTASATATAVNLPAGTPSPVALTLGAPATPGGYPTLYLLSGSGFGTTAKLYSGSYPGSGATVTWSLFGPTGTQQDLPVSCQLCGIQSIRGDWNVYGRLYVSSNQSGFAYYNP